MRPSLVALLAPLAQLALLVAFAPLFAGLTRKLRALLCGGAGPPLLGPYRDLRKLLAKEELRAEEASWVQDAAPAVAFGATVAAAGLVPAVTVGAPLGAAGGIVAFMGLLALARAALVLGALDPGGRAGPGAAREMLVASLAEPTMTLALFALAVGAGTGELGAIAARGATASSGILLPSRALAAAAFVLAALAPPSRIEPPSRTPAAETALGREALLADHGGAALALLTLAEAVRRLALWTLFVNVFLPWGIATDLSPLGLGVSGLMLAMKLLAVALGVAGAEAALARRRFNRAAELLGGAFALGALALLFVIAQRGSGS